MREPKSLADIFITELEPGDGIRLAVKDLFDTAGVRTTYGSAVFAEHVPRETAEAVSRLERSGYTSVGKTNLHEFAYGVTSQNLHYGTVPNPTYPGCTAGGSSGGSAAALAAGLADAALGTDTGGSIRIPAACCAVVGFKPSYGLVSTEGVFPLAPSFDHAGPMARDVATCAAMMRVLADVDAADVALGDLAIATSWGADSPVAATPIEFPTAEDVSPAFMREVADVHRELYAENADLYGENVSPKIERCLQVVDSEVEAAAALREAYCETMRETIDPFDLLVTPTLGFVAPRDDVNELEVREAMISRTYPFNLLGWPALALPCGPAEDGLPASIQLVGRPGDDALVLAAGLALEAVLRPR